MRKIDTCKYCGKEFIKTHNKQKYCSKPCRHKAKLEQNNKYKHEKKEEKTCKYCGKKFIPTQKNKIYCSKKCLKYAIMEQKEEYQQRRRKLIYNHILISNELEKLGTSYLKSHRKKNFNDELQAVRKEKKRIKC